MTSRRTAALAVAALAFTSLAVVATSSPAAAAPPPNDAIAFAQPLPATGDVESTNVGATVEPNEVQTAQQACPASHTVWFAYQATSSDVLRISTRAATNGPTEFDPGLSIWTSSTPAAPTIGSLQPVECNDDVGLGRSARVEFRLTAGTTYFVQVSTYLDVDAGFPAEAPFSLRLETSTGPANDDLAHAAAPPLGATTTTDTNFSTLEPGEPTQPGDCREVHDSNWFSWTAPASPSGLVGDFTVDSLSLAYGDVLNVYRGPSAPASFDDLDYVACSDFLPDIQFPATPGTTYWFQVSDGGNEDNRGGQGPRDVRLDVGPAPANDDLADALDVSVPSVHHVDSVFASAEPDESPTTALNGCYPDRFRTQWFRYQPTASGRLDVLPTNRSGYGRDEIYVFTGPENGATYDNLTTVGCTQNYFTLDHTVPVQLTAGQTYYISAGTDEEQGAYDLRFKSGTQTMLTSTAPDRTSADLHAAVTPLGGMASGTVEFSEVVGGTDIPVETVTVAGNQATTHVSSLPVGTHTYRAEFHSSDPASVYSSSAELTITVGPRTTTTSVRAPAKVKQGRRAKVAVTVVTSDGQPASGVVTVSVAGRTVTVPLVAGAARFTTGKLTRPGRLPIAVTYLGGTDTVGSTTSTTIKVKKKKRHHG